MAWKVKKEWEGKSINSFNCSLEDLSQNKIKNLKEEIRDIYFEELKPKKKKSVDSISEEK